MRRQIEILVIDDDEFTVGKKLEVNNFHLTYKKDVENIKDVSAYQIILCDIRGVGIELDSKYEGAFMNSSLESAVIEWLRIRWSATDESWM